MVLCTSINWLLNFIIAFIMPLLFKVIKGGYYFLLMKFCIISGIFVYFVYPKTTHSTPKELGEVFGNKTTKKDKHIVSLARTSTLAVDDLATSSASQVTLTAGVNRKPQVGNAKEEDTNVISQIDI
jgi:hypothetical protein